MSTFKSAIRLGAKDELSGPVNKAGGVLDKFNSKLNQISGSMGIYNKSTAKLSQKFKALGGGIQDFGKKITLGVTAPITAAGIGSLKAFGDFENGMLSVKTLLDEASFASGDVEKGFAGMKSELLALSRTTSKPMSDLVKGLFDTVSAGISGDKAVKTLAISSKLATAGLTDIAIATDGVTSALNAWEMSTSQAESVAAKFFTAQKRGKTTVGDLASNLGKVAFGAKTVGISLDEVLAAVSAVTLGGVKTNEAFTGLKAVFNGISKPSEEAKKAAKALGIEFSSSALRGKGFTKFMEEIIFNAKRIGVEPALAIEKLFGSTEAMTIAQGLAGSQAKSYANILKELQDETQNLTTFNKAFETQNASLNERMGRLKNQFLSVAIAVGERLAPQLGRLETAMTRVFSYIEQNPEMIKLGVQIAAVAAALGPLMIAFGGFLSMAANVAMLAKAIGISFGVVSASVLAIPLAIGGAIAAGYLLIKNWEAVKDAASKTWGIIADGFAKTFKPIIDLLTRLGILKGGSTSITSGIAITQTSQQIIQQTKMPDFGIDQKIADAVSKAIPKTDLQKPPALDLSKIPPNLIPLATGTGGKASLEISFKDPPPGLKIKSQTQDLENIDINVGAQGAMGGFR